MPRELKPTQVDQEMVRVGQTIDDARERYLRAYQEMLVAQDALAQIPTRFGDLNYTIKTVWPQTPPLTPYEENQDDRFDKYIAEQQEVKTVIDDSITALEPIIDPILPTSTRSR